MERNQSGSTKSGNVLSSFLYAARGIAHCVRSERSFRLELALALPALLACVLLEVTPAEAACVILCCAAVLGAELLNSALERVVDLAAGGECSELAKRAKDLGAGAVLVAAAGAVAAGACVFLPRVWAVLFA